MKAGLYDTIRQAFAVLLPVKTVGVMGDGAWAGFGRNNCNGPHGSLPVL